MTAERGWAAAASDQDLDRSLSYMADDATMLPPAGRSSGKRRSTPLRARLRDTPDLARQAAIGAKRRCIIDIWNEALAGPVCRDQQQGGADEDSHNTGGGGTPLRLVETGNPRGRPILFIHGFSQCSLAWNRQLSSDLAESHRLVALDLRAMVSRESLARATLIQTVGR